MPRKNLIEVKIMSEENKELDNVIEEPVVETVTSEEFAASEDGGSPAPKKKFKMTKKQIIITSVLSAFLIVIIVLLSLFLPFLLAKPDQPAFSNSEVAGFSRSATYVAIDTYPEDGSATSTSKSIDLKKVFPYEEYKDATFTLKSGKGATITDNVLTANTAGVIRVEIAYGEDKTLNIEINIVEGCNVFSFAQLEKTIFEKKNVVLQSNIAVPKIEEWTTDLKKKETLLIESNVYGNAYKIDATAFTTDTNASMLDGEGDDKGKQFRNEFKADEYLFTVDAANVQFINIHMVGKTLKEGDYALNDYCDAGELIVFPSNADKEIGGAVKYCVLERAHRIIHAMGGKVSVENNLLREASDSCVSIETNSVTKVEITLKDNVMINPQVAGVINYCLDASKTQIYPTINIEGILDIYNWKNETTASLMPITEGLTLANIVNGAIQSGLGSNEYDKLVVNADGHKWVHIGFIILSTGGAKNYPIINGLGADKINFVKRELPFPSIVSGILGGILKTRDMYGYENGNVMAPISSSEIEINADMFKKIGFPA